MRSAEKNGAGVDAIQSDSVLSASDKGVYEGCDEKGNV